MSQSVLDAVVASLPLTPSLTLGPDSRMETSSAVHPFVEPDLLLVDGPDVVANVVFIEAPAAVGKSTLARHLAARTASPLLDLSRVRVSTASLAGLLATITNPIQAREELSAGRLGVIVDALDEARLLSGEKNFEDFLTSTWQLLSGTDARIVMLGRTETVAFAELSLQLSETNVTSRRCQLGYFRESEARQMVFEYATVSAADSTHVQQHQAAANLLIDHFFQSIEEALGIEAGALWANESGRRFAGYAPVLATLGGVIANTTNFAELDSRLQDTHHSSAWGVIEDVCRAVLEREREKLASPLASRCKEPISPGAYNSDEQVRALIAYIAGLPVAPALKERLSSPNETDEYHELVQAFIEEHPFTRGRQPASGIFAAVLVTHAIVSGIPVAGIPQVLGDAARQPFLWRSLRQQSSEEWLMPGDLVGVVLSSALTDDHPVHLEAEQAEPDEAVSLTFRQNSDTVHFLATEPIILGDTVMNARLRCGIVVLRAPASSLRIIGPVAISCGHLAVETQEVVLANDIYLSAKEYSASQFLRVVSDDQDRPLKVNLDGALEATYPWSSLKADKEFNPFGPEESSDALMWFLTTTSHRLAGGAPIVLSPSYTVIDDERIRWAEHDYPQSFPLIIEAMIRHGLAVSENFQASGSKKVRVRFFVAWSDLKDRIRSGDAALEEFAEEARRALKRDGYDLGAET